MNENENERDITLDDLQKGYEAKYGNPSFGTDENAEASEQAENVSAESNGQGDEGTSNQTEAYGNTEQSEVNSETYSGYANQANILEENNLLKQQVLQLRSQLEQSQQQNQALSNEANQNFAEQITGLERPTFDEEAYSYASDDERAAMMNDFSEKLIAYSMSKAQDDIMKKLSPILSEYQKRTDNEEFNDTMSKLQSIDGMGDISKYADTIRAISSRDEFKGMNPYMRATNAALIAKGLEAMKKPNDINARVDEIYQNPELLKALEQRRIQQIESGRSNIPPSSASNGLASTVYQPKERPQKLEDLM